MKIVSMAAVKADLSTYLKESQEAPVIVTRKGKPVAVLLGVTDQDELERLVLAHSPKFQAILEKSRRQIAETGGIPHEQFWQEVEAETHKNGAKSRRGSQKAKPKRRS
jgi:prevent-host-death family protein